MYIYILCKIQWAIICPIKVGILGNTLFEDKPKYVLSPFYPHHMPIIFRQMVIWIGRNSRLLGKNLQETIVYPQIDRVSMVSCRFSLQPILLEQLSVVSSLCWLFPPTGCSRADTLLNVHFALFFTVFSASRQCCPGGEGGGRNNCFFEWCFLPLSICTGFYSVFRSFALFFLHHLRFPLVFTVFSGFMTLLMLRCTLGWGGVGQSRSCELDKSRCWGFIMLLMLQGGMLTFHVTCSRCWCYATLGWGGC